MVERCRVARCLARAYARVCAHASVLTPLSATPTTSARTSGADTTTMASMTISSHRHLASQGADITNTSQLPTLFALPPHLTPTPRRSRWTLGWQPPAAASVGRQPGGTRHVGGQHSGAGTERRVGIPRSHSSTAVAPLTALRHGVAKVLRMPYGRWSSMRKQADRDSRGGRTRPTASAVMPGCCRAASATTR